MCWNSLRQSVRDREGIFTLTAVRSHDLTREHLRSAVARGEISRIGRGVYRFSHRPEGWRPSLIRALEIVPNSAVSHASAARLLGWADAPRRRPEIITTFTGNARVPGVTVHRTRRLADDDTIEWGGLPSTSGARTTLDLTATTAAPRVPELLDGLLNADVTTVSALRRRLDLPGGGQRNRGLVSALIGPDGAAWLRSELERLLPALCHRAALPVPVMNAPLTVRGQLLRPDAQWLGTTVLAELLGLRFHSAPDQVARDAQRHSLFAASGHRVLLLTWADLTERTEATTELLRDALARC